jgi:hypothetical protein
MQRLLRRVEVAGACERGSRHPRRSRDVMGASIE